MGWLSPKCPVSDDEKLWLEDAAKWLVVEFGIDHIRKIPVILPNLDFFPDPFNGSESDVEILLKRVCRYINVNPQQLNLQFYNENQHQAACNSLVYFEHKGGGTAGYFKDESKLFTIGIETSQLKNHIGLVGTMVHELGHVILLGEGRVSPADEDQEFLTDLLTVFLGMGIFTANSAIVFETNACGWQAQKRGYLTEEMFGYALALFAHLRNEDKPTWAKFLNTNVRSYFKNSLRFINKNGTNLNKII